MLVGIKIDYNLKTASRYRFEKLLLIKSANPLKQQEVALYS